jgi:Protein of unknown function (DUF2752)
MTLGVQRIQERTLRSVRAPLGTAIAAFAAVTYVGLVDPNETGHYPTCPFLALTGYYCPGCGSLRAVHDLAHGHLTAAIGRNVLTVVGIILLAGIWVRWLRREWQGKERTTAAPAWAMYLMLGVTLAFWLLRNLPVGAALAP